MTKSSFISALFNRYTTNSLWLLADRFSTMGLAFLSGIIMARTFEPAEFGRLSFAIGFVQLFVFLTELGLDQVLVKEVVCRPNEKAELTGSAFVLHILGFLLTVAAVVLAGLMTDLTPEKMKLVLLVLCGTFGTALYGTVTPVFEADMKIGAAAPANIVVNVLFFAVNCTACYFHFPLMFFAFTNGAILLVSACVKWQIFYRLFGFLPLFTAKRKTVFSLLKKTKWLFVQLMLSTIASNIAYPVLQYFCAEQDIGFYSITAKIEICSLVFAQVIAASMFPAIIEASEQQRLFHSRLKHLYLLVFWGGIFAVLTAYLLGPFAIRLLYGKSYIIVGQYLWIALLALPLNGIVQIFVKWCIVKQFEYAIVIQTFASAASALVFNIIGSKYWGFRGVVWSLFAGAAVQWIVLLFASREIRRHIGWLFLNLFMLRDELRAICRTCGEK